RRHLHDRMIAGAVDALAGVDAAPHRSQSVNDDDDPLQAALHAVAKDLGVRLGQPSAGGRTSDRVREIAQASGLRTRTVLLSGKWWCAEHGPLLAYREDGSPVALLQRKSGFFGVARYEIFDPAEGTGQPAT